MKQAGRNVEPKRPKALPAKTGDDLPAVPIPEVAKLTENQRRFLASYVRHGVASRAARDAGYSEPHEVTGYAALRTASMQAALAAVGITAAHASTDAVLGAIERRALLARTARRIDEDQIIPHALRAIEIDARLAGDVGAESSQAPGGASMTPDAAGEIIGRLLAGVARGVMAGGDRDSLVTPVDVRLIEAEDDEQ